MNRERHLLLILQVVAAGPQIHPTITWGFVATQRRCLFGRAQRAEFQQIARALRDAVIFVDGSQDEPGARVFIAANPSVVEFLRERVDVVAAEFEPHLLTAGSSVAALAFVAHDPGQPTPTTTPKRLDFIDGIAGAIASLKAYDVAAFCDQLGLPAHPNPDADPFSSKAVYVRARLASFDLEPLFDPAARVLDELRDAQLESLVQRYRPGGAGAVKNLVFASTSKPDLVLLDALSNDLGLVNPGSALFYDGGIPVEGLSLRQLTEAILPHEAAVDPVGAARSLHARLRKSLGSEPESFMFVAYARRYRELGIDQPALLPQVWLHYDPRTAAARGRDAVFQNQRMDFLLLLPRGRRVVLEVDGAQHYADGDKPSPSRYAQTMRADRRLRLDGYEVFRFGGAELPTQTYADELLMPFFEELLR